MLFRLQKIVTQGKVHTVLLHSLSFDSIGIGVIKSVHHFPVL